MVNVLTLFNSYGEWGGLIIHQALLRLFPEHPLALSSRVKRLTLTLMSLSCSLTQNSSPLFSSLMSQFYLSNRTWIALGVRQSSTGWPARSMVCLSILTRQPVTYQLMLQQPSATYCFAMELCMKSDGEAGRGSSSIPDA
jgi:hypothetical protein